MIILCVYRGGKNKNASDNTSDTISEHIIGYHSDTAAAIILMAWEKHAGQDELTEECTNKVTRSQIKLDLEGRREHNRILDAGKAIF